MCTRNYKISRSSVTSTRSYEMAQTVYVWIIRSDYLDLLSKVIITDLKKMMIKISRDKKKAAVYTKPDKDTH
jgi:hypothetical protein